MQYDARLLLAIFFLKRLPKPLISDYNTEGILPQSKGESYAKI
ncbi:hypothetical protein BLGI_2548 [Brevibacillus laterosporus GI-9]|nr:hypothetical protein BLGI_2548 [Brevibacillus laterosporus GI-9]